MYVYGEKVIPYVNLLFAILKGSEHFSIVFTACPSALSAPTYPLCQSDPSLTSDGFVIADLLQYPIIL